MFYLTYHKNERVIRLHSRQKRQSPSYWHARLSVSKKTTVEHLSKYILSRNKSVPSSSFQAKSLGPGLYKMPSPVESP